MIWGLERIQSGYDTDQGESEGRSHEQENRPVPQPHGRMKGQLLPSSFFLWNSNQGWRLDIGTSMFLRVTNVLCEGSLMDKIEGFAV